MVVVEVAIVKDVWSSCSSESVCSSSSKRISSGHVVVKVTGLLEKVSSPCSKSCSNSRIGYSGSNSVSSMKSRSYSKRSSSSSSGSKGSACSCTISNSFGGSRSSSN